MNNITCTDEVKYIFNTRQTMQVGFAPYSDISRNFFAELSFVSCSIFAYRATLQMKYHTMLRKFRKYLGSVSFSYISVLL